MLTGLKLLVIWSLLFLAIKANRLPSTGYSDIQCAFSNTLCDRKLDRPCCDIRDACTRAESENIFKCTKKDGLGKFCFRDEDCDEIQHAKCSKKSMCECRPHSIKINPNKCGPLLGGFCWKNELCMTDNSICIDNECQCIDGYSPRSNSKCVFDVLGAFCETDETCRQVKFAKCLEKTCQCSSNTILVNPSHCAAAIGGFCWTTEDCFPLNSICIDKKCQCKESFVLESNGECTLASIGMPCKKQLDCTVLLPDTICSSSRICTCKREYFAVNSTQCSRRSESHPYCRGNNSCTARNFICKQNICQCKPNYIFRDSKCLPGHLYEPCSHTLDCELIEKAVCSDDSICICDRHYSAWNGRCRSVLGGFCSEDQDCIAINSFCIDKICECKGNYTRQSEHLCILPRLGMSCNISSDCASILNAKCSEKKICECIPDHAQYSIAACAPLLGGRCTRDKICAPINSFCTGTICLCQEGYMSMSIDKCIPHQLSSNCQSNNHCEKISGSTCVNNSCVCADNHMIVNGIACRPLLDEYCNENLECAPENSVCIDNKCQCMNDFKRYFNHRCSSTKGHFNISCDRDDHCDFIKYAVCSSDKKCACALNYIILGEDKCIALIGEYCDLDEECTSYNTRCVNHKCQCTEKFSMRNKYQCDRLSLGHKCQTDRDCTIVIKNSVCSDKKICTCQENFYALNEYECISSLHKSCTSNDDCRFNSSVCIDEVCQCDRNFRSVSASQCVQANLLFRCQDNLDCGDPWHNKCSYDKMCVCNENNILINLSTCSPHLGGYCWIDHQCVVENSHCVDYRCECRNDFRPVASNRCALSYLIS